MPWPRLPLALALLLLLASAPAHARLQEEAQEENECQPARDKVAKLVALLESKGKAADDLYKKLSELWSSLGEVDHEQLISNQTLAREELEKAWKDLDLDLQTSILKGLRQDVASGAAAVRAAAKRVEEVAAEATRQGAEVCATVKQAGAAQGEERKRLEGQAAEQFRALEKGRDDYVKAVGELRSMLKKADAVLAALAEVQAAASAVRKAAEDLEKKRGLLEAEAGRVTQKRVDADVVIESLLERAEEGLRLRGLLAAAGQGCEADWQVRRLFEQAASRFQVLEARQKSAREHAQWFEQIEKKLDDAVKRGREPVGGDLGPLHTLFGEVSEEARAFRGEARTELDTAETFAGRVQAAVDAAKECLKSLGGSGGGGGGGQGGTLKLEGHQVDRQPSGAGWTVAPGLVTWDTPDKYRHMYFFNMPKTLPGSVRLVGDVLLPLGEPRSKHQAFLSLRGSVPMEPAQPDLEVPVGEGRGTLAVELKAPADTTRRYEVVVTVERQQGPVIRFFYSTKGNAFQLEEDEAPPGEEDEMAEPDAPDDEPMEDLGEEDVEVEPPPRP